MMEEKTKKLTSIAMLCAIAYVAVVVARIPVALFLKYEPKDVIIVIGGFLFGPLTAFAISLLVSFVEMFTISDTGFIGLVMNVLASCAFACTASYVYKKKHTMGGAITGLILGTLLMTIVMLLWNYLITPLYLGYPREAVTAMLLPLFLPFNLLKGGLNTSIAVLIYKPLVTALRKANLLPPSAAGNDGKKAVTAGFIMTTSAVLATCVLLAMVLKGAI